MALEKKPEGFTPYFYMPTQRYIHYDFFDKEGPKDNFDFTGQDKVYDTETD